MNIAAAHHIKYQDSAHQMSPTSLASLESEFLKEFCLV